MPTTLEVIGWLGVELIWVVKYAAVSYSFGGAAQVDVDVQL
ncbi:MAG: hypothetical protein JWO95_114 [Verrucomicrobiales bacterium]|nr:hypothetical protein [Verrucomicrobiales bacterium]